MLKDALLRTRQSVFGRIAALLGTSEIGESTWDELEALLLQADLGVEAATEVVQALQQRVRAMGLSTRAQLQQALREALLQSLPPVRPLNLLRERQLNVVLIVGVNGSGKTTTIAKLAHRLSSEGWSVLLAAADTYRAAAIEQLQTWGRRLNIPVVAGQMGGDPGAATYDAIRAARAREHNLVLVDTAGRLHTKHNLMEELQKVRRVAAKSVHEAPHEVWLVVDGTTGQNALAQAAHFQEAVGVTGIIITKLDSTARGGMAFGIARQLGLPIRFVGTGENVESLTAFDAEAFVDGLFE